jgi:hypothetical protein
MTLGASSSFIFYDATSSRLTLTSGVVDGAQSQYPAPGGGGAPATAGADPPFADDPLIDGFAIIRIESAAGFDQVTYQGFDPVRQLHTFSGGTLTLQHFDSFDYAFNATFDELLYDPVSGDGFALFSTVSFTDLLDTAPSVFLDMLTDAHLFGDDPDSMGMMFTFNLPGLAEGSNGFTQDFFSEETTFFLTGVLIPEPTTVGMLLVLLPVIARRRLVDGRKRDKYIFGRPTGTTC